MSYTPQETSWFDQLFNVVDKEDAGVLPGQDALPFLMSSNLPQQTLGEIWALADPDNNGFLTKDGWYRAARLIGWMQKPGQAFDESLLSKSGPLPKFQGHNPPIQAQSTGGLPSLTPADRTKFTRIFVTCGPQNGLVAGDKARDVFLKSKLGYDKLGQIWNLADTQQRGSLDLADFIIGMYLIQSCMANPSVNLPASLPPGIYESASGGRTPTSPIARQNTGPSSPLRQQYTGMSAQPTGRLSAQPTGNWDVTPDAKATSDRFFTQLDTQNRGVIDGDVAVPFMVQSQLDESTLASIWDLADIQAKGQLGRDEFAVAMHLINMKLAGKDIPTALPPTLIPPSLRGQAPVSSTSKDLFDLFNDPPAPVAQPAFPMMPPRSAASPALAPPPLPVRSPPLVRAPPSDLLGDDLPRALPDNSAEIGNKTNQLTNTNKSVTDLEKTRADLEKSAQDSAAQLEELEAKLSSARTKHEAETKAVADLRIRVGEQSTKLKQLNTDVITAESDLTAMRMEKDEMEQALLRDKEEVRGLQKKMKEIEDEKSALKVMLEKLKKDTRQQKGMVTIAKKQLSTAETSRDAVQKEVRDTEDSIAVAASVPLPATPRALSPAPTGTSQRSNNPFDRLGVSRPVVSPPPQAPQPTQPPETSPGIGATALTAAGVAAGVVVAGAATLYNAAKDVVSPESEEKSPDPFAPTENAVEAKQITEEEQSSQETQPSVDPFGAENKPGKFPVETDPFGASSTHTGGAVDGFGDSFSKTSPEVTQSTKLDSEPARGAEFDDGFGESLSKPASPAPHTTTVAQPEPSTDFDKDFNDFGDDYKPSAQIEDKPADFDSAFADFDGPKSPVEQAHELMPQGIPTGIPKSVLPADLRPEAERTASTQAVTGGSRQESPVPEINDSSDDEEEGPEDVEGPKKTYSTESPVLERSKEVAEPVLSPPITSPEPKTRRSAPPPPARPVQDEFDPFGASSAVESPAQVHSLPPGAAPAKQSNFDDDDFDFSDLPPATVDQKAPTEKPAAAFDDEFAGFDDDFEKPSTSDGSNGLSKSYEMVSADSGKQEEWGAPASTGQHDPWVSGPAKPQQDEWGLDTGSKSQQPASAFSFDDAFGGEFDSTPSEPPKAASQAETYAPPPGPPPGQLAPALPQRQESTSAQADDIEDVKKLCAMGFPRTLVIGALDANGYDFQKALNVLIS